MKTLITYTTLLIITASLSACTSYSYSTGKGRHGLPPGKAKKITGTKSAKPFAPGQRNKKAGKHHRRHDMYHYQPAWQSIQSYRYRKINN